MKFDAKSLKTPIQAACYSLAAMEVSVVPLAIKTENRWAIFTACGIPWLFLITICFVIVWLTVVAPWYLYGPEGFSAAVQRILFGPKPPDSKPSESNSAENPVGMPARNAG